MGLADKLKDMTKRAQDVAATHKQEVRRAIVKAEEAADKQTGGQYHDQILKAGQKADAYVENLEETPAEAKPRPAG